MLIYAWTLTDTTLAHILWKHNFDAGKPALWYIFFIFFLITDLN